MSEDVLADIAAEAADLPETPRPPATLEAIQALGAEVNVLDERIGRGEELLKELKARKNAILFRDMVEMMDQVHVEEIKVAGRKFKVGAYYKASIPEEHRDTAHTWLEEHDAGDLIKREVVTSFPKEFQEEAEALTRYIREHFQMATVEVKKAVPWATLTKWLRELFEAEEEEKIIPPLDIMGATVGRIVKIEEPKRGT